MADLPKTIGPFAIVRELGRGGMGVVYHARQEGLDRDVAVKVLLGGAHTSGPARERFLREARAAAKLRHPHIVEVYDAGLEGDLPYIAMAYIEGRTLDEALSDAEIGFMRACEITAQIADALQHAHDQGIVHRDIKPANILLDAEGRAYLTDFGLAREVKDTGGLTRSGAVLGTPSYMSPEQARGDSVDPRADVYGLGAVLYEMCTGTSPFEGDTALAVITQVLNEDPRPPSRLAGAIPRDLEVVCLTALAKEPHRRYPNAAALGADCRRVREREPILARAPGVVYRLRRFLRRHRALTGATAATMATTAALVWWLAIWPVQQRIARDQAALAAALAARQAIDAQAADAVASRDWERAVALGRAHHGQRPTIPELEDPREAADARWDDLRVPYRVALAEPLAERGLEHLAAGRRAEGRRDLAEAYRLARDVADRVGLARRALLALSQDASAAGETDLAARLIRLCVARYGADDPAVEVQLATALDAAGDLDGALPAWQAVRARGGEGAGRAAQRLELLEALWPRARVHRGAAISVPVDLDGDGRTELLTVDGSWRLRWVQLERGEWRERAAIDLEVGDVRRPARAAWLRDCDGDGAPELCIATGDPRDKVGALVIVSAAASGFALRQVLGLGSRPTDATLCDLDGDGVEELVVAVDYYERGLRCYRRAANGEWTEWCRWPLGADPLVVHRVAPDALLLFLGGWTGELPGIPEWRPGVTRMSVPRLSGNEQRPWGWRFVLLGRAPDGAWRERAGTTERFAGVRCTWERPGRAFVTALATPGKIPVELQHGFFRVDADATSIRLTPLGITWKPNEAPANVGLCTLASGRHAAIAWNDRLWLAPVDGGPIRQLPIGVSGRVVGGDFDGDGDSDVVVWPAKEPVAVALGITGVAAGRGAGVPLEVGTDGQLPVERELLDAGLAAEAETACRARLARGEHHPTRFTLALALAAQERWADAAEAFGQAAADRALAADALLRRMDALERVRDWPKLAATAALLVRGPGIDEYAREQARAVEDWAQAMSRIERRVEWTPSDATPWHVENPFKVRRLPEGVEHWTTTDDSWDLAGVWCYYDGGPLRLRFRFQTDRPAWATAVTLGMVARDAYLAHRPDAPRLAFMYGGRGNTADPTLFLRFDVVAGPGLADSAGADEADFQLAPGVEHEVTIDYIPARQRAWLEVRDARGRPVAPVLQVRVPVPLEAGAYLVGPSYHAQLGSDASGDATRCRVLGIQMDGDVGLRLAATLGRRVSDRLYYANWQLVSGDVDAAIAGYDAAIRAAEGDRDRETLVRALMFRALARWRRENATGMRSDGAAARRIDGTAAAALLHRRRAAALTDTERGALASALGR